MNQRAAFVVVVAGLLSFGSARASPGFPSEMRDYESAPSTPQCTVCHTNNAGGVGTITKDFGIALQARGLVLEDNASLHSSLDKLAADGVDSDGDGTGDVDEIKAGTDPNVADASDGGPVAIDPGAIQYGFGCSSSPSGADAALLASSLLSSWALLAGRFRTRSRRRALRSR